MIKIFIIALFSCFMVGCASSRLKEHYDQGTLENRESTEMDFKSSEELDEVGRTIGRQN